MNSSLQLLLEHLADGEFHSGESLGNLLGISRAAVWKQLQQLQELGVELNSIKGLGYCVEGGLDLLRRDAILDFFKSLDKSEKKKNKVDLQDLLVETSLGSTSQTLVRMSSEGKSIHATACFAETQTAGRGRRGRIWQSPFASNLYFSLGWRIQKGVAAIEGLSLAVGVALCDALESFGFRNIQLKWPNDLLYKGKKLGGILLEINGDAAGECDLVLGVGINISMSQKSAEGIDQPWTDLAFIAQDLGVNPLPTRNELAAGFLFQLMSLLSEYETTGFIHWRERWQLHNANQGKNVRLILGSKEVQGKVQGVNESGALLLLTDAGVETFIGGEISLRSLNGDA